MFGLNAWLTPKMQFSLALGILALAFLLYYFTNTFNHWRDKGVKFVKPYPLVGSIFPLIFMRESMFEFYQRLYKKYGCESYVGLFRGRTPCLLIRDPVICKQILVKDFQHFTDHGIQIHEEADPLEAKNLFHMKGDRWKEMRAKLTPTFTSGRMKSMFPLVLECAQQFEHYLAGLANTGEEFEAKDLLSRYTTDVIGSCAFGIKCNSLEDPNCEFRVMGRRLVESNFCRAFKTLIMMFLPEIGYRFRFSFIDKSTANFFRCMVRDVMTLRSNSGETRKDFMQLLIELKEKGRLADEEETQDKTDVQASTTAWTDDDVTAQAAGFFLAGFETSSSAMSFALLELAVNPDVQRRAQQEIYEVLKKYEGKITYEALQDMKYLDCVIQETLRKYPPLANHARVCTKSYAVPGTDLVINKGTMIGIPVHALQNDPKYFYDPDRFDPERFSNNETGEKNKGVFMPFGEGPRMCIGSRFAMMQSKLGLISMLRKYEVKTCPSTKFPITIDPKQIILTSKGGVWVKLSER